MQPRKKKVATILFVSTLHLMCSLKGQSQLAVIVAPVLDLGKPPSLILDSSGRLYNQFPLDGGKNKPLVACPRTHQLIYHEIVEIKQNKEPVTDMYDIIVPNIFYVLNGSHIPQNTYRIHKKNLITFKELKSKKVDINKFPEPISFIKKNNPFDNDTVALIMPHINSETKITFSAGTRFKRCTMSLPESDENLSVYAFDKKIFNFRTIEIPKHKLMITSPTTNQDKIKAFVQLARDWAHIKNGFIPYVWGGSSYIHLSNGRFTEIFASENNVKTSFFELDDYPYSPRPGLDCSGLVWRAAQICGIPYYCKNTATIAHYLKELENSKLEDGDLILIPRHVMIVSSVKNNKLVEARSYGHGYGKVQELSLKKVFKGMNTYQDLINAYHNNQTIYRLNSEGIIAETISQLKLIKFSSVWS